MIYKIHNFDTLTSTNDTATEAHYTEGHIVVARFQSAGRGQRGNKWVSSEGENLMFSLVLEPTHILVRNQFILSITAALATAKTIESYGISGVKVKWPNDIYVGDKKISGILIEHSFSSQYLSRTVIGIGINVAQMEFNPGAGDPTSLHLLGATDSSVQGVLERFCGIFSELQEMSHEELHSLYMQNLYRGTGVHPFEDGAGRFQASISEIDLYTGVMTLLDTTNAKRSYYFKEVAYL